jgi:hypothetical protein
MRMPVLSPHAKFRAPAVPWNDGTAARGQGDRGLRQGGAQWEGVRAAVGRVDGWVGWWDRRLHSWLLVGLRDRAPENGNLSPLRHQRTTVEPPHPLPLTPRKSKQGAHMHAPAAKALGTRPPAEILAGNLIQEMKVVKRIPKMSAPLICHTCLQGGEGRGARMRSGR